MAQPPTHPPTLGRQFEQELQVKEAKLDTDPHLWMPLTLDKGAYVKLMAQKVRTYPRVCVHTYVGCVRCVLHCWDWEGAAWCEWVLGLCD
jgi:hypothetical protein